MIIYCNNGKCYLVITGGLETYHTIRIKCIVTDLAALCVHSDFLTCCKYAFRDDHEQ